MDRWLHTLATAGGLVVLLGIGAFAAVTMRQDELERRKEPVRQVTTTPEGATVYRVYDPVMGSRMVVVGPTGTVAVSR